MPFDLFPRNSLEQDTGLLKERWDQEGSTIINVSDVSAGATEEVIYTVTAGKTLYVKAIFIYDTAVQVYTIKDDTTTRLSIGAPAETQVSLEPYSPFIFSTNVKFTASGGNAQITILGWEE